MGTATETYKKIQNSTLMVIGIVAILMCLRSLFNHQYAVYYPKGRAWIPTIAPLIAGAWLFVIGLLGYIRERRTNRG